MVMRRVRYHRRLTASNRAIARGGVDVRGGRNEWASGECRPRLVDNRHLDWAREAAYR